MGTDRSTSGKVAGFVGAVSYLPRETHPGVVLAGPTARARVAASPWYAA
jgi:hypothetical protein